jgi:hypothetical protein
MAALTVGVFDAEEELPSVLAREGVVEEGDVRGPDVRIPSR